MELILKIAWRNILRHRGKSLIIGIILFLGALLMTFGNAVISGMDRGLEENIVNSFLGDIVIISEKEKSDNILMKMMGESISKISNYREIKAAVEKEAYIKGILPAGKNAALIINEEGGDPGFSFILGVDFAKYLEFFPGSFRAIEGRLPHKNEAGILIPDGAREEQIYDRMGIWVVPEGCGIVEENLSEGARENLKTLVVKRDAVFMGFNDGNTTTDIRLGIKGIIKYKALNKIWGHFSIVDIESYRQCLGYFSAADSGMEISGSRKDLLEMENENLDAMFGSKSLIVSDSGPADFSGIDFKTRKAPAPAEVDSEAGIFNIIFVKLKDGYSPAGSLKKLNRKLSESGLGVRAVSWKSASGFIGNMATIIKGALFTFTMFLFFVAVIIIVNTLTMAALERTPEIGMMRAIGARKSFISWMFIGETAMLSFIFGGLGVITGLVIVKIIPLLNITTGNDMVQLLYGGDRFQPFLSAPDFILVLIQLILVTLVTVIYPVRVARNITPLDAISRE